MQSYKNTLNLPTTNFPMKANLSQKEPETLKFWQELNLYHTIQKSRVNAEKFILPDGPPYANGDIHIGHALNKILKDIVVKAKTLSGFNAPFVPGWDCHGLPIELNVEKEVGKPGIKLSVKEFRAACRKYAESQIQRQLHSFVRLGVLGDWENPYKTMDYKFEADIIRTFAKIIANGHLHKGERPVHWCINCGSSLAEAEVEYKEKTSPSIYVLFHAVNESEFLSCFNLKEEKIKAGNLTANDTSVVIWTTTPWTLPANEGVAIGKDITYVLIEFQDKKIVLAIDRLQDLCKDTPYKVLGECLGESLEFQKLKHPFYNKEVQIILGDHVTLDAGTGCVHTAPAHGQEDYAVGLKYNLPVNNPVGANGAFLDNVEFFAGLNINKANDAIVEILQNNGNLLRLEKLTHSYPHCWRHKTPLIFRATPQWFISMEQQGLRELALKVVKDDVKWVPDWGMARMEKMLYNRPDWCVSRQRVWGVPMALFIHKQTKELHPDTVKLMEKVALKVEKQGVDVWYELDAAEILGADAASYERINDVLDVWFDSGAYFFCVLEQRADLRLPADLYLEGSDQHRGWFQSSLLASVAVNQKAPYKEVLTHGFTVDADGRKMSKSLGNVIEPEKIVKTYGADVLRLWVATTDYQYEQSVGDEILKRTSDAYRRIRNTARFLLANLADFDSTKDIIVAKDMVALDQWIVAKTKVLQLEIIAAYNEYNFHSIYQKIHNFCAIDLGSFYLDIIKDRQYTCKANGKARRSCQTAMHYIIEALTRWLAPILSFTAEEIWQHMKGPREKSVFLTTWYNDFPAIELGSHMNEEFWQEILNVRTAVNKIIETSRAEGILGAGLEAEIDLYCSDTLYKKLQLLGDELKFVLITSQAKIHTHMEEHNVDGSIKVTEDLNVKVTPSVSAKCDRCWHRRDDVNLNPEYPNICTRCIENITTEFGENRKFA